MRSVSVLDFRARVYLAFRDKYPRHLFYKSQSESRLFRPSSFQVKEIRQVYLTVSLEISENGKELTGQWQPRIQEPLFGVLNSKPLQNEEEKTVFGWL